MEMEMEMEMISREFIKPSSPTPPSQKIYKLSLLDQIVPPIYVPLVLYYPNSDKNHHEDSISQILKESLSSTLSHFYPLAGRIRDTLSIDCNDEGVLFLVSRSNSTLSDILRKPDPKACRTHIPSDLTWDEPGPGDKLAMVKLTFFRCGSFAVGSLFLHKIADGVTVATFMKAWASRSRTPTEMMLPDYKARSFFPHNEAMQREKHLFSAMRGYFKSGKTVMRRYVFESPGISRLRAELSDGLDRPPTRVEIVSALIWKWFMIAADKARPGNGSPGPGVSLVTHGVNMRRKAEPRYPDGSFGNFLWLVTASSGGDEAGQGLKGLFGKVRDAIGTVDPEFVKRMEDGNGEGFLGYCKNVEDAWKGFPEGADYLAITSWCNFGLYGIDFGFGRPAWITKCDGGSEVEWPFINVLWLMDTPEGDGIEAWLTLDQSYFAHFDQIQEIRDFASVDPPAN
ncbi:stemmadenine O-acetyltransferase-like [Andrographis paniculata]|uniref:stemmadenine O-acetyltransferase-like n=1 Tax=Andrographis paniculata TaxID=175694 RepID=UPI0021E70CA4|nr:stemmadenine O-acetyltransferase-like [Andrographis paniculata]